MTYFIKNRWYLAAWSTELTEKPFGRKICGEAITFYRQRSGGIGAVASRCPHRFAPMHYGTVDGDNIRCRYHGLAFGPNGKCVENPDTDSAPNLSMKSYEAREDAGGIWVWIGDEPATDELPSLLRDAQTEPYGAFVTGYIHVKCNHVMIMDNLTDHSHAHHLHDFLRGAESMNTSTHAVEEEGDKINVIVRQPNEPPAPFFQSMRKFDCNVDRQITSRWQDPTFITIDADIHESVETPQDSVHTRAVHLAVPETKDTTHYFWTQSRSHQKDNAEISERMKQGLQQIFTTEDVWIMEGQQDMMEGEGYWDLKPALLPQDKGSVLVRRRIEKLIKETNA